MDVAERSQQQLPSVDELGSTEEWRGIRAAYEIATQGKRAVAPLLNALQTNSAGYNEKRRYAENGTLWHD